MSIRNKGRAKKEKEKATPKFPGELLVRIDPGYDNEDTIYLADPMGAVPEFNDGDSVAIYTLTMVKKVKRTTELV